MNRHIHKNLYTYELLLIVYENVCHNQKIPLGTVSIADSILKIRGVHM